MVALHAERRSRVRGILEALTESELDRIHTAVPAPAWGEESHSLGKCLRVVMNENCEHRRCAMRDLALIETR